MRPMLEWRFARYALGLAIAFAASLGVARAETFPDRPVRIIVPFPAGGTADAVPRLVADWLSRKWGQPVVIENHTGCRRQHRRRVGLSARLRTATPCCRRRRRRW